jgi:lysophospholipase L1-like esterase
MKLLQIILISLSAFSGCTKKADNVLQTNITAKDSTKTMTATDSITYLALGDSYTIGQSVPLIDSYPYQLTNLLRAQSYKVQTPTIIATTGWTTADLIAAIASSNINSKKFNFVTLLIGVNDQYQNKSQTAYRADFAQVLNTAINFANGDTSKVFVLSIPDYGVTPFANGQDSVIGPLIDQFNAINKDESQKRGVNYLDITDISRQAALDPSLIAGDGLHPSAAMYGKWMLRLEPLVASELKK